MARARLETMRPLLVGKDPLAIEVHFQNLTSLMHTYMAHIPTISGIDMALWDLAGKITGLPVSALLGGPFRESIPMYSHGVGLTMLDKQSCKDFAARVKSMPEGFTAFKCDVHPPLGITLARFAFTLDSNQLRQVARAYGNIREAVGAEIDIAVHCHNELDAPSAIGVAKAVEFMNPLFIEDPLPPPYSEAWASLRRSTRLTLFTGEKLELVRGFRPFLDNQAVDIVHPDLAFAGGFHGGQEDCRLRHADPHAGRPGSGSQRRLAGPDLRECPFWSINPELLSLREVNSRAAQSLYRRDGGRR